MDENDSFAVLDVAMMILILNLNLNFVSVMVNAFKFDAISSVHKCNHSVSFIIH